MGDVPIFMKHFWLTKFLPRCYVIVEKHTKAKLWILYLNVKRTFSYNLQKYTYLSYFLKKNHFKDFIIMAFGLFWLCDNNVCRFQTYQKTTINKRLLCRLKYTLHTYLTQEQIASNNKTTYFNASVDNQYVKTFFLKEIK